MTWNGPTVLYELQAWKDAAFWNGQPPGYWIILGRRWFPGGGRRARQEWTVEMDIDLQDLITTRINRGEWIQANIALRSFWRQAPSFSNAGWVKDAYQLLKPHLAWIPCRLAILRSFTLEPAIALLQAEALTAGIDLAVQIGDFNSYVQEILNETSTLYHFSPTVVILGVLTRDIAPELWSDYSELTQDAVEAVVNRVLEEFRSCIQAFRLHSQADLIVHSLEQPPRPARGVLDGQSNKSQMEAIHEINCGLREIASASKGVYILDYDGLVARAGRLRWQDEGKWLSVRMPIAAENLIHLVHEWMRFLHPLTGKVCKALVVDLDGTLWGGVVGEDGPNGIQLGVEYPGNAYLALQKAILDLTRRGILLAVCSKNNPEDVREVLDKHPHMILRQSHFAALRINWQDKVRNLREIATELNIGIDSLAFLDDNPVERALVQEEIPEITVIELPKNPEQYVDALRATPVFERLTLSAEDSERSRYYAEDRQRKELENSTASLEDFYRSLQMEVEIRQVTPETLARIAQLTQKTNQFNLTTRRYSEQQISEYASHPDYQIFAMRVRDRFGDNGLVGVTILHFGDDACEIDTFLLSCRVIGRTVETALLAEIIATAHRRGARVLRGWFLPTKKNAPSSEFYPLHGFHAVRQDASGTLWELDLSENQLGYPEWIRVTTAEN